MQIILFLFFYTIQIYSETHNYYGEATDQKTNIKIYTDKYFDQIENNKKNSSVIEYHDQQQRIIAKKNVNFTKNRNLPDFKLEDFRDGYMEGGEIVGNQYKLYYKKNKNDTLNERILEIKPNAVTNDGLDQLIKSNFEELLNGKKIKVYFYVPYQLDFYKFTVEKVKMTEKELFIKVAIDIDILKPFISNTYITYNIENKKIIYYEGISIINNSNGRSYFIKHNYFHNE